MTANYKKTVTNLIKIAVVAFAFWFIYTKLNDHDDIKSFINLLHNIPTQQIILVLGAVFTLMLINWGIEAVKWQKLVERVEKISLWRSIESVFCGLTWAVFTPNRLGEYGGRVFFLSPKRRVVGIVAMTVGNIGQMVLTNVFGAIAVCIFVYLYIPLSPTLFAATCLLASLVAAFFVVFYFNIRWLNNLLLSIRFTRRFEKFYTILGRYEKKELLEILGFCTVRYAVFTSQYVIMFLWLTPDIQVNEILLLVPLLFFVQSSLPSLDLLDIGVRSVTALFFFKYVTTQNTAVVACIASIWLINIIIPAILGAYFVFKLNFFGNTRRQ